MTNQWYVLQRAGLTIFNSLATVDRPNVSD